MCEMGVSWDGEGMGLLEAPGWGSAETRSTAMRRTRARSRVWSSSDHILRLDIYASIGLVPPWKKTDWRLYLSSRNAGC